MAHLLQICTEIPADASANRIDQFARSEGDTRSWNENRVAVNSDFGGGRFTNGTTEQLVSDSSKQVCQKVLYWGSEHAIIGRIVVHYGYAS